MRPPPRTWWAPAARAVALASVAVGALRQDVLLGGLGVLAAVWIVALFAATTVGRETWLGGSEPREHALYGCLTGLSAAALLGGLGPAWIVGAWVLAAVLSRFGGVLGALAAILVVVLLASSAAIVGKLGFGWEVLVPTTQGARGWLGPACAAGALAGWVPFAWSSSEAPLPGRSRLPWFATGITLGVLLAWAIAGTSTQVFGVDVPQLAVFPLVTAGAWGLASAPVRQAMLLGAAGILGSLYFQDAGLRDLWWTSSLPILLGAASALRAFRTRSWAGAVLAVVLIAAGVTSYPGLPGSLGLAGAAALPWVVAFWCAGVARR